MVPEPKWSQLQWIYAVSKLRKFKQTRIMIWGSVRNALFDGGKRCFVAPYAVYRALLNPLTIFVFFTASGNVFNDFAARTIKKFLLISWFARSTRSTSSRLSSPSLPMLVGESPWCFHCRNGAEDMRFQFFQMNISECLNSQVRIFMGNTVCLSFWLSFKRRFRKEWPISSLRQSVMAYHLF